MSELSIDKKQFNKELCVWYKEPCICFYCTDISCENAQCNKCTDENKSFEMPCCSCSGFIEPIR